MAVIDSRKISYTAFDQYFIAVNINRIEGLMACEIENLIEYHWNLLKAEQMKHDHVMDEGKMR